MLCVFDSCCNFLVVAAEGLQCSPQPLHREMEVYESFTELQQATKRDKIH